ncbi:MAG: Lrp/AsnC family transcriptional regulator [Lactobacillus sp.]|nr:Lrp/AsnC family transcriptional regulator [Lactobacillus sp.]
MTRTSAVLLKGRILMTDSHNRLINLLQQNARATITELAKKLFISNPSVSAKLHKLEKEHYITGYQAQINHRKLGYHIKAYIMINVAPADKPDFQQYIEASPNIIFADVITGAYSILMCAYFQESEDLENFINEVQRFGRTQTNMVFSTLLAQRGIALDESDT